MESAARMRVRNRCESGGIHGVVVSYKEMLTKASTFHFRVVRDTALTSTYVSLVFCCSPTVYTDESEGMGEGGRKVIRVNTLP